MKLNCKCVWSLISRMRIQQSYKTIGKVGNIILDIEKKHRDLLFYNINCILWNFLEFLIEFCVRTDFQIEKHQYGMYFNSRWYILILFCYESGDLRYIMKSIKLFVCEPCLAQCVKTWNVNFFVNYMKPGSGIFFCFCF